MKSISGFFIFLALVALLAFEHLAVIEVYANGLGMHRMSSGPYPVMTCFMVVVFALVNAWVANKLIPEGTK